MHAATLPRSVPADLADDGDRLLGIAELGGLMDLGETAARNILQRGEIPGAFKHGKTWKVPLRCYRAYVTARSEEGV